MFHGLHSFSINKDNALYIMNISVLQWVFVTEFQNICMIYLHIGAEWNANGSEV